MRRFSLLWVLGALLLAATPVSAQQRTDLVEVVVDVRIQGGPSQTIRALAADTTLLLPVTVIARLAEVPITDLRPAHAIRGELPGGWSFTFDTDRARLTVRDSERPLVAGDATWQLDELYVRPALLGSALGVRVAASQADLLVTISDAAGLPAVRRMAREAGLVELVVDLRIQNGPARTIRALGMDTTLLVPVVAIARLAEARIAELEPQHVIRGDLAGRFPFAFVTDSSRLVIGPSVYPLTAVNAVWFQNDLYVTTDLLSVALRADVRGSQRDLLVTMTRTDDLPVVRRMARERTDLVELIVDVRIQNGPSTTIPALGADTTILIPVAAVARLAEVRISDLTPAHRVSGELVSVRRPFTFDTDSGVVTIGDSLAPLPPRDAAWYQGDLYVRPDLLGTALGVHIAASQADLLIHVTAADQLPVVERLARERRRARLAGEREGVLSAAPALPATRGAMDGAVFDWSLTADSRDPIHASLLQLGLGAQVLGGSAILEHAEQFSAGGTSRRTTGSWVRAWHTQPYVRQLRLGEIQGTGRLPRIVQGLAVTNAPFLRPALFAVAPLSGMLAPGWEVELYRDRQLVAYGPVGPTGAFTLDLPIRYGDNPVEVVGYGPNGEIVRYERTFAVAPVRLPRGQFEYGLAGGACAFDPCQASGNVDLRYGATAWLTTQVGADYFRRDTLPDVWHPYGSLAVQPTRAIGLFAEGVVNAEVSGRIDYAPSPNLQAALGHTRYVGDVTQPILGSATQDYRTEAFAFVRPGGLTGRLHFRLDGVQTTGAEHARTSVRVTATSTRLRGTRFDAVAGYVRARINGDTARSATVFEVRAFHVYAGSVHWLRGTLLRAELAAGPDSGLQRVAIGVNRAIGDVLQFDAGAEWLKATHGVALEVGLSATLPMVRAYSRNRFQRGGVIGTQIAEGSLLWDRGERRMVPADGRSLGRAGLSGVVFVDENGDGLANPGERRLASVRVRVGAFTAETDADGRFAVWDLVPFELVDVEVDASSVQDPLIVPENTRFTFRPDPNSFTPLPLPFVTTGEVSGQVAFDPGGAGVAGVEVLLTNLDTGDQYTVLTYSDGTFYQLGVRPGAYRARLTDRMVEQLHLAVEPALFTVGRDRDRAVVDGVIVKVRQPAR